MNIQFDEKNLLADMVGKANGLGRSEIERSKGKALKALKSFRRQSDEGRYGFPHLPFQTGVIQAIGQYAEEARGSFDTVCVGRHRRQCAGRMGSRLRHTRPAPRAGRLHRGASATGDSR